MDIIDTLGGPAAIARICNCKPPSVVAWRQSGIPPGRCPAIELAMHGAVTCEEMRADVPWLRVPDFTWPHPMGRPVIDIARPLRAAAANDSVVLPDGVMAINHAA